MLAESIYLFKKGLSLYLN
jgi:hypothetical protein